MSEQRSEQEVLMDAAALYRLPEKDRKDPGALAEVREVLSELHDIGSPVCIEAARRLSRRFL